MAQMNGKMMVCDRCGENVFLKCVGEGEMDGGYTRWNKFEATPHGWSNCIGAGLLCPACKGKYEALIATFMGDAKNGRE